MVFQIKFFGQARFGMLYHIKNSHVFSVDQRVLVRFLNVLNNFWRFRLKICVGFVIDYYVRRPVILHQVADPILFHSVPSKIRRLRSFLTPTSGLSPTRQIPNTRALPFILRTIKCIFPIGNSQKIL